jgi:hypothetical protein
MYVGKTVVRNGKSKRKYKNRRQENVFSCGYTLNLDYPESCIN